jgi:secondary thiamine-phosphate synthase enzyme
MTKPKTGEDAINVLARDTYSRRGIWKLGVADLQCDLKIDHPGAAAASIQKLSSPRESGADVMKSYRKELWFNIPDRRGLVNITSEVQTCIQESGIQEGLVLVNAMHITASVFVNDDEHGLHQDYEGWLERLAPHAPISQYLHNRTGEDNADAHMKRQIMGREATLAITAGQLDFGPWEQIFYYEFDGRRKKRVLVKIIGE